MFSGYRGWLILSFAALASVGCVSAGFSLSADFSRPSFTHGEFAEVNVTLASRGGMQAYHGAMGVVYPQNATAEPLLYETIPAEPGKYRSANVRVDEGMLRGTYPLIWSLQFTDETGYQLNSVFATYLDVGEASVSDVRGELSPVDAYYGGDSAVTLRMENDGEGPHDVEVRLIAPQSLRVHDPIRRVNMAPHSSIQVAFNLSDSTALEGSTVPVVGTMEYEDTAHHGSIATGSVRVVGRPNTPLLLLAFSIVSISLGAYAYSRLMV
jgi:hypothetical protein